MSDGRLQYPKVQVATALRADVRDELDELALERGMSLAALVREILLEWMRL